MRQATDAERSAVVEAMALNAGFDQHDFEFEQFDGWVVDVSILDRYTTDTPGYSGSLAVAIFSGGYEFTTTLAKRGETWEVVKP